MEKNEKKLDIFEKKPKFTKNPKKILKSILIYLNLIREENDVNELIDLWNKNIILWLFSTIITGFFVNIPLTLLLDLKFKWYTVLAWGITAYIIEKLWGGYINGRCKIERTKK